jgi:hypothetical protein
MTWKELNISITELAGRAPHPQAYYDQYHEDDLDDIEDGWPNRGGYVCIITNERDPDWVGVRQTPDVGLLASWGDRQFPSSCFQIAAAQYCEDRFKGLDNARERIGRVARERGKHVEGVVQFFKIAIDDAKAALGPSI